MSQKNPAVWRNTKPPVIVNMPNLLPGTTYHYRLVATNGGGTAYGPDMTFTTGEYPAAIVQEPVSLRTLLVPSELGKTTSPPKQKKQSKKTKKRKRGKAGHRAKRSPARVSKGREK